MGIYWASEPRTRSPVTAAKAMIIRKGIITIEIITVVITIVMKIINHGSDTILTIIMVRITQSQSKTHKNSNKTMNKHA